MRLPNPQAKKILIPYTDHNAAGESPTHVALIAAAAKRKIGVSDLARQLLEKVAAGGSRKINRLLGG